MRKSVCILLMLMGALSASAQHYVGLKGGYGGAKGRLYSSWGTSEGKMIWNRTTAGVMWKYYSPQPVWGGISAELEYQQRGYSVFDGGAPGTAFVVSDSTMYRTKTRTVNSVTLPLMWQPHLYMMNRRVRVWASVGVTLTYNLGTGDKYTVAEYTPNALEGGGWGRPTATVVEDESGPYMMQRARDVRWNYGWLGGAGIGVLSGRWEFFAEGRYYYGMSDLQRTMTKYKFNEEELIRSELDNLYITIGVFFRLGKGGILAPPLRKRAAPSGADDFRNIKLDM